jgi:hypothetical protein
MDRQGLAWPGEAGQGSQWETTDNHKGEIMTDKTYQLGEGMPTAPDVAALQKQWPELKIGDRIPYGDVEAIIGHEWRSSRFRCVTEVWRRRELDKGLVIGCIPGEAFYVLSASDIHANTPERLAHIRRTARKQRVKIATIRPENDTEKMAKDHGMLVMLNVEREMKKAQMNVLPKLVQPQRPQIGPPEEKASNGQAIANA